MQASALILLLVAIPIVFCLLTWVVATTYRIYVPEKRRPVDREVVFIARAEPLAANLAVTVGVREIKEDQIRRQRRTSSYSYAFSQGISSGVPSGWLDDLQARRN